MAIVVIIPKNFCGHQPILTTSCREQGSFRPQMVSAMRLPTIAGTNIAAALCQPPPSQLPPPCHLLPGMALPQCGQGRQHIRKFLTTSSGAHDCLCCSWPQIPCVCRVPCGSQSSGFSKSLLTALSLYLVGRKKTALGIYFPLLVSPSHRRYEARYYYSCLCL